MDEGDRRIGFVEPGGGHALWWLGGALRYFALGAETGGRYCAQVGDTPAGGGPAPHVHSREEECFYVVRGGPVRFTAGDAAVALGAGGFVTLSPGTAHHFRNEGEGPATLFTLCAPAGFDRFQIEAGRPLDDPAHPAPATDGDRRRVVATAPAFGIDMHPDPALFRRSPKARIVPAGTGAPVERDGIAYTVLAAPGDTGGRYALALASVPAGGATGSRRWDAEAGFYVLDGAVAFTAGGRRFEAAAGAALRVPAGMVHGFAALGDVPARLLAWVAPAVDAFPA